MQYALPEIGKTYVSSVDPSLVFFVEDFHPAEFDPDDGVCYGFVVNCCRPGDQDDQFALGHSFTAADWVLYAFVECA